MSFVITPSSLKAYQFPDDADEGRSDFLGWFKDPNETWLRAYGFTMPDLVAEIIDAHKNGTPIHVLLDHTQEVGHFEHPLAVELVQAGVETTVCTSYAGSKYIAHEKGFVTSMADCWEGSVNFSSTGWEQINSAFAFNSPVWRDHFVASFVKNVKYAWANERAMQLMSTPPAYAVAA